MAKKKNGVQSQPRLTPREALARFYDPRPTRRQLLGGLLVGAVSARCSDGTTQGPGASGSNTPPPFEPEAALPDGMSPDGTGIPAPAIAQPPPVPVAMEPAVAPNPPALEPAEVPVEPMAEAPNEPMAAAPTEPAPVEEMLPEPDTMEMGQEPTPTTVTSMEPPPPEPVEPTPATPMGRTAYDLVELGSTGIVTSRLAMGSGTNGTGGSSVQTRMGEDFTNLLIQGYDRGIRFFETADAYGSHRVVGEALRQVGRENVTVLTKTMAETREEAEADLERFMEEIGTDYLDIVLLHIRTSPSWVSESEGAMEVLAEAKARGQIRAHGVSCHSLEALRLAAETDWVDLDLARINPFRLHMDSDTDTVKGILEGMKASGKAVLGMKILGQGDAVDRFDEAIEYATRLDCIHGFTIGFTSTDQLDQVATKIASTMMG